MGSTCHVYKKEHWEAINEGNTREGNKPAVQVKVGEWNDYGGGGYLSVWMLNTVYAKIMLKEYSITSQAYAEPPILIFNKNEKQIDLLTDKEIDD